MSLRCYYTSLVMLSILTATLLMSLIQSADADSHCWKRKYLVTFSGRAYNATVQCNHYYQWTVAEYCCYDRLEQSDNQPYCCYSEIYKLLVIVGIICVLLLSTMLLFFLCWCYNVPHYLLKFITCGKFNLNDYMKKTRMTGPYVDPSFYAGGEPFWTSEGSEFSHYPLRPMPPRIFYPVPAKVDLRRWSHTRQGGMGTTGQTPLFVLASRQFTRNPYSARPHDRGSASSTTSGVHHDNSSRRSSTSSCIYDSSSHRLGPPASFGFRVHIDEVDAASELLEALRHLDEKKEKTFTIPKVKEETSRELELDRESEIRGKSTRVLTTTPISPKHLNTSGMEVMKYHAEDTITGVDGPSGIPGIPPNIVPTHGLLLDATKLTHYTSVSPRTGSGTSFRKMHLSGNSFDSSSTSVALESISEEQAAAVAALGKIPARMPESRGPNVMSNTLPGYIPEEADLRTRQSINTA